MARIVDAMQREGAWLFRWRSYLPLLLVPLVFSAVGTWASMRGRMSWRVEMTWELFCIGLGVLGTVLRCLTVGFVPEDTSGRNTRRQKAGSLNTTGVYSLVRHPLYLANCLVLLGLVMYPGVWWVALIASLAFWIYYERIMVAEEAFLAERFGAEFDAWAAATPAFVAYRPRLWRWPDRRFCLRTVLRREYSGLMTTTLAFAGLEYVDLALYPCAAGRVMYPTLAIIAATACYLILRYLKHRSAVSRRPVQSKEHFDRGMPLEEQR